MSFKTEDLGNNSYKLTIEVEAAEFEKACEAAFLKNRSKIQLQGFRKGKAPRQLIEKVYGKGVFYEDAANELIPDAYTKSAEESGLEIVSRPEFDVVQIESGKNFIFTATVDIKPVITVENYKGIEIDALKVEVTDSEVDAEIDKLREQNARTITVDDRAVQDGDIVNINYEGSVDGVPFDGGKADDYDLTIGSHSFIDTFEEQLIGKNIGDDVEVNVTFPEEYHAEELKGKAALFKVQINAISTKELPDADDELASEASDFDTLDELKADIKAKLLESKEKEAKTAKENAVMDKIIENTAIDIPKGMLAMQKEQMAEDFARRMQAQGLQFDMYLKYTGMTVEQFLEQMEPQAEKNIKYRLVLEAVAKAENIEISDEELEKEFADMAANYKMEVEKVKELIGENEKKNIRMDLAVSKALDIVRDAAVEK